MLKRRGDESVRGRPLGGVKSRKAKNILGSIVGLAVKHKLDPRSLLDSFILSRRKGESKHGVLTVKCRELDQNRSSFMVLLDGDEAIWQFSFNAEILYEDRLFESVVSLIPPPKRKKDRKKIGELKFGMQKVTLKAIVVEVPESTLVSTRFVSKAHVSNVLLADETGNVRLSLWNKHIGKVTVGDTVLLKNVKVSKYLGEIQLRLGKMGRMTVDSSMREAS